MSKCGCHEIDFDPYKAQKSRSKLSGQDILKIKLLRRRGMQRRVLAKRFGVSEQVILCACRGDYDHRIEEWKTGRSLSTRTVLAVCEFHKTENEKAKKELREVSKSKHVLVEIKKWLKQQKG